MRADDSSAADGVLVGRAVFDDLRIYLAGRHQLQFISDGMVSHSHPIIVLAQPAKTFLILRQPPATADVGKVLTKLPVINLVDKYNNTIMLDPEVEEDPMEKIIWETTVKLLDVVTGAEKFVYRCLTSNCPETFLYDKTEYVIDEFTGIVRFTNLVLQDAGNYVLKFGADGMRGDGAVLNIEEAQSQVVRVSPGALAGRRFG